jgi:hypothetical protein
MTLTSGSDYQIASQLLFVGIQVSELTIHWQQLGWWFVATYWITLYDLGQVIPDYFYGNSTNPYVAVSLPSTNNIFLNATLFETYFNIWNNSWGSMGTPGITLNATNRLHANPTTFLQTYACVQREPKPIVSILINVLVADVSLTLAAYGFIIWVLEWFGKRHSDDGEFPLIIKTHELDDSNFCLGHKKLLDEKGNTNSVVEVKGANDASN